MLLLLDSDGELMMGVGGGIRKRGVLVRPLVKLRELGWPLLLPLWLLL